ncbi:hypothetical protein VRK_35200 [Vibrio sp. MEBiC08052]|nr:hypothetical protein VRK_35200 [Vibrio sp. MEBiC08052]
MDRANAVLKAIWAASIYASAFLLTRKALKIVRFHHLNRLDHREKWQVLHDKCTAV